MATPTPSPSPAPSTPAKPMNISTTKGAGEITIKWDSVPSATSYFIYYASESIAAHIAGGGFLSDYASLADGGRLGVNAETGTITGLDYQKTYYFIITAENLTGSSGASDEVSDTPNPIAPATVTGVTGSGSPNTADISWTAAKVPATYTIYYANESFAKLDKITDYETLSGGKKVDKLTDTDYKFEGLTNFETYYFVVTAENVSGVSSKSNEVKVTPSRSDLYISLADLNERYGEQELLTVADKNDDGKVDFGLIETAIEDAMAQVDSYLSNRYTLPLKTTPTVLKRFACDITIYILSTDTGYTEQRRENYNDALKWLKGVADGKINLGLVGSASPTGDSREAEVTATSSPRRISRSAMLGI